MKNGLVKNELLKTIDDKLSVLEFSIFKQIEQWTIKDTMPNIFEVLSEAIYIMQAQITVSRLKLYPSDILIQPKLGHIRFIEFGKVKESIKAGYEEAMKVVEKMDLSKLV